MSQVRQAAFDVVNKLRQSKRIIDVLRILRLAGDQFGYNAFLISNLPSDPGSDTRNCALLPSWPDGWRKRYFERGYLHIDPVATHIRSTAEPFLWSDVPYDRRGGTPARIMNEATDFGLHDGFCVPIHHINGREGGVSFGADRLDLNDDARAGLHLIAMYAYGKVEGLIRSVRTANAPRKPKLSRREVECLQWVSAGKTAWEASTILSVSERTVEFHLRHAALKLNAVNRTQSVAEALRHGIIA